MFYMATMLSCPILVKTQFVHYSRGEFSLKSLWQSTGHRFYLMHLKRPFKHGGGR